MVVKFTAIALSAISEPFVNSFPPWSSMQLVLLCFEQKVSCLTTSYAFLLLFLGRLSSISAACLSIHSFFAFAIVWHVFLFASLYWAICSSPRFLLLFSSLRLSHSLRTSFEIHGFLILLLFPNFLSAVSVTIFVNWSHNSWESSCSRSRETWRCAVSKWVHPRPMRIRSRSIFNTVYSVQDSVDHNRLWATMLEMGFSKHLTNLIKSLYDNQEATVRTACGETANFGIEKGVCQGCILSPVLFNLYAEMIMRKSRKLEERNTSWWQNNQ